MKRQDGAVCDRDCGHCAFPDCIEIIKPDFEEYRTQPSALGLDYIDVAMPSPKGMICAHVEKKQ